MSITNILSDDALSASDKLAQVSKLVSLAREHYGNEEHTVSSPDVNTTEGMMSFSHLTPESKAYILRNEVQRIRAAAVEYSRSVEGGIISKKVEELVATNPMLCNIENTDDFSYI